MRLPLLRAAVVVCAFTSSALATPDWLDAFKARYGSALANRVSCNICHNGDPVNDIEFHIYDQNCYKKDILHEYDQAINAGTPFLDAIAAGIAAADGFDSDGDGVPNGVEATCNVLFLPEIGAWGGYNPGLAGAPGHDACSNDQVWSSSRETPLDTDGDGVADCLDHCPLDANKTELGDCGCGQLDTDSDGDTVADCDDQCDGLDDLVDENDNDIPDCLEVVVFTVNNTADSTDANPGDGVCADSQGRCTLRAAIMEANALAGLETILVPAGAYTLTIGPNGESGDSNSTDASRGDLDIDTPLNLIGDGAATTMVDADELCRVFQIRNDNPVTIANLTITGGKATAEAGRYGAGYGGGVFNLFGTVTITGCAIVGNSAQQPDALGGGIYNAGDLTLTNSTIANNTVNQSGAGTAYGGGLCNDFGGDAITTAINCTFSGNSAAGASDQGGGLAVYRGGQVTLMNCTLANNSAAGGGGGVYVTDGATLTTKNTILAGNTNGNCLNEGTHVSNGHNISSDGSCSFAGTGDMNSVDPLLGPLQDNGGSMHTHAVAAGSPAIDGGDNSGAPGADQRGLPRPTDGDADGDAAVDVGAAEFSDCSGNDADDGTELASGDQPDCNTNRVPDLCEMAGSDCNENGVPDVCESLADADDDDVPDACDVCPDEDDSVDADGDGTPDCADVCPLDSAKTVPGECGCGVEEAPDCIPASDGDELGGDNGENGVGGEANGNQPFGIGFCGTGVCGAGLVNVLAMSVLGLTVVRRARRRNRRR